MHWAFSNLLSLWAIFQVYSNRAACYTKFGALPEGLKDAEKCIELDPTFSKGYTRKGAIQFFMKEYDKALETYQAGLKHDPKNQELLDGVRRYNASGRYHDHLQMLVYAKQQYLIVAIFLVQVCRTDQQGKQR